MAFAYTVDEQFVVGGSLKIAVGTFTASGGGEGGDIKTGLQHVKHIELTIADSSVGNDPVANETFPLNKGDVTIVCDADETGTWAAYGY